MLAYIYTPLPHSTTGNVISIKKATLQEQAVENKVFCCNTEQVLASMVSVNKTPIVELRYCLRMPTELGNPQGAAQLSPAQPALHISAEQVYQFWVSQKQTPSLPHPDKACRSILQTSLFQSKDTSRSLPEGTCFQGYLAGGTLATTSQFTLCNICHPNSCFLPNSSWENTRSVLLSRLERLGEEKGQPLP